MPYDTPTSFGDEFLINTHTADTQYQPAVATLEDGNFLVIWTSIYQDGDFHGIFGQKFTANGEPIGNEFQINTYTTGSQVLPVITALSDGGFLVAWSSEEQNVSRNGVYAQRYDAGCTKIGSEFRVNSTTAVNTNVSSIDELSNGNIIITWHDGDYYSNEVYLNAVYGQLYDLNINKIGSEFLVSNELNTTIQSSDSSCLDNGRFVIAYLSDKTNQIGAYGKIFDASGNEVGSEFIIDTPSVTEKGCSAVNTLSLQDGSFVVAWTRSYPPMGYGEVYFQRFDSNGIPAGSKVHVNENTADVFCIPNLTLLSDGSFIVIWNSTDNSGNDGTYGQRYDTAGNKVGDSFKANSFFSADISISALNNGSFVVNYTESDANATGVYGQIYKTAPDPSLPVDSYILEYCAKVVAYADDPTAALQGLSGYSCTVFDDGQGFHAVGIINSLDETILTIRGTAGPSDYLADLDPASIGRQQLEQAMLSTGMVEWLVNHPGTDLTGHSLGGAQTQILAHYGTTNGIRVGDIYTFNSPGINNELATIDTNMVDDVFHYISAGDVVSMAGHEYIPGNVVYYDYNEREGLQFILDAHTGHWAQPELYDKTFYENYFKSINEQFTNTTEYHIQSGTITEDQLSSGMFSHLWSGGSVDEGYFALLYCVSRIPVIGIGLATSLVTRETAELAREDLGTMVNAFLNTAQDLTAFYNKMNAVGEIAKKWTVDQAKLVINWTADIWKGFSELAYDGLVALKDWSADRWVNFSTWTAETFEKVKDWTTDTWQASIYWSVQTLIRAITDPAGLVNDTVQTVGEIGNGLINAGYSAAWSAVQKLDSFWDSVFSGEKTNILLASNENHNPDAAYGAGTNLLVGDDGNNVLTGGPGLNYFVGGSGDDTYNFGGNTNIVIGNCAQLAGDTVYNFQGNDIILFNDAFFNTSNMKIIQGSAIIHVDADGDGVTDSIITLKGDFANRSFTATQTSSGTEIRLVPLTEGGGDGAPVIPTDHPGFSVIATAASKNEGDENVTNFTFTVTRLSTDASSAEASVHYTVAGSGDNPANDADFLDGAPSGSLTFLPGETVKTISVAIKGDATEESDESFTVVLTSPSNGEVIATDTATGVILNDDHPNNSNPSWFNESYYLDSKLKQLQNIGMTEYSDPQQVALAIESAGLSVFDHYCQYSLAEGTSPNQYFNTTDYIEAKTNQLNTNSGTTEWTTDAVQEAFFAAGFTDAFSHFKTYGWLENVNPSNAFDISEYFSDKSSQCSMSIDDTIKAFQNSGLDPISHYESYGKHEGVGVTSVKSTEFINTNPNFEETSVYLNQISVANGDSTIIF